MRLVQQRLLGVQLLSTTTPALTATTLDAPSALGAAATTLDAPDAAVSTVTAPATTVAALVPVTSSDTSAFHPVRGHARVGRRARLHVRGLHQVRHCVVPLGRAHVRRAAARRRRHRRHVALLRVRRRPQASSVIAADATIDCL